VQRIHGAQHQTFAPGSQSKKKEYGEKETLVLKLDLDHIGLNALHLYKKPSGQTGTAFAFHNY
jgi:hypothetical protein